MRISKVELDAIHITKTYAGQLEGAPPKSYIIERAKRQLEDMWGKDRPIYVVPTNSDLATSRRFDARSQLLPHYQYMAWFNSWTPVEDKDKMGSHLFLIWWDEEFNTDNLEEFAAAFWVYAKDYDI